MSSDRIQERIGDLVEWLNKEIDIKGVAVSVEKDDIILRHEGFIISAITVEDNSYKILIQNDKWKDETTYSCEKNDEGEWFYYVDSSDECIAECKRMVKYEIRSKENKHIGNPKSENLSNRDRLYKIIEPLFEGTKYEPVKPDVDRDREKKIALINRETGIRDYSICCHHRRIDILVADDKLDDLRKVFGSSLVYKNVKPGYTIGSQQRAATSLQGIEEDSLINTCRFITK